MAKSKRRADAKEKRDLELHTKMIEKETRKSEAELKNNRGERELAAERLLMERQMSASLFELFKDIWERNQKSMLESGKKKGRE